MRARAASIAASNVLSRIADGMKSLMVDSAPRVQLLGTSDCDLEQFSEVWRWRHADTAGPQKITWRVVELPGGSGGWTPKLRDAAQVNCLYFVNASRCDQPSTYDRILL